MTCSPFLGQRELEFSGVRAQPGGGADRAMWPELVIVSTPILHLCPCIVKAHEPVRIQALGAELAVETFDVAVVGRLAWSREVEHDALMIGP